MKAIDLDNASVYKKYDPEGMLAHIKELPSQCLQAWQATIGFNLPDEYSRVDRVIVIGMGGSAIGGDLAWSLVMGESKVPIIVHRDYNLPAFVNDRTMIIASSFSGNTEETVSAFEAAVKTKSKKLVITTGGKLLKLAQTHNVPVFKINYKAQPRAALGYSFLPALGILQKTGLIKDKSVDVSEAIEVMGMMSAKLDEKVPLENNPAKQLAQKLMGRLPVIYGAGIAAEVARRWKTQFNENSKVAAFYEVFPELNHNATVGYTYPSELTKNMCVIMLRTSLFDERVKLRYAVTGRIIKRARVAWEAVDASGKSPLCQMMSLVFFGDLVSYYLAILNRVDPSPVNVIAYLKRRLARG